jgi:release factor glutamine methyltransferase
LRLLPIPGVHRPRSDTWLLADALRAELPSAGAVADLCTGSGVLAILAALGGAERVVAVDVSLRATLAVRVNAALNGCRVEVRRGDLFASLGRERFDVLVCNPPYVPATTDELPRHRSTTPLDGGRNGRAVLDRVCREAPEHLTEDGTVLLVQSSVCGVEVTCDSLRAQELGAEIVARARGPLGPVLAERAPMMRERGLLGEREEEDVVVIRARPC